jgi:hypothetical protein
MKKRGKIELVRRINSAVKSDITRKRPLIDH